MNEDRFAELSAVLATKINQIQRALQALQQAQPHDLCQDSAGATMRAARLGDWIPIDDVVKAIQILQEGQQ